MKPCTRPATVSWRLCAPLLFLLLLTLSACTGATLITPETPSPATTPGVLAVVDAWARAVPVADGNSAAYMTILNGLDTDVTLTDAASSISGMVQLHETTSNDGVMSMNHAPDGWVIPAGGTLTLAPGGKHVMIMNLSAPLAAGEEIDLLLTFDNGDIQELTVPVRAME